MDHDYLIQRFHPKLRIGFVPSVLHDKHFLMLIHCQQGGRDSACGAHCAAIAMALLGDIHDVALLSERRNGVAARLWEAAPLKYFGSVAVDELAPMIDDMDTERKITVSTGRHIKCLYFVLLPLEHGNVVIASWHSRRDQQHHWTTIVRVEGRQSGRKFAPSALLCLDPRVDEPVMCDVIAD